MRRQGIERWRGAWPAVPVLACLVAAHPAWRAVTEHRDGLPTTTMRPAGFEAEEHFPGAALIYAADPAPASKPARPELAAPAPGTTGTVAPPPEPVLETSALEPATAAVVAAPPFALGHATALDRGRALECLAAAVYYEAGNQSDDGERAVAQVVLNRVHHPAFPATICGVVYQGSEHAGCQFSFACDGSMARARSRTGWARALRIAADALAGQVYAPVGLATHYHTYAVTPAWNRALVMTDAVGAHFFHRWKGYWGTLAAFRQPWAGREPMPGPHPRLTDPVMLAPDTVVPGLVAAAGPPPLPPPSAIQPAHSEAGAPVLRPGPTAGSLPQSQVLDRWKDSGKPLQ